MSDLQQVVLQLPREHLRLAYCESLSARKTQGSDSTQGESTRRDRARVL